MITVIRTRNTKTIYLVEREELARKNARQYAEQAFDKGTSVVISNGTVAFSVTAKSVRKMD